VGHARLARSLPRVEQELLEVEPRPLGDQLDRTILTIADPTSQIQRLRMPDQEESKADALHLTRDHRMKTLGLHASRLALWYTVPS